MMSMSIGSFAAEPPASSAVSASSSTARAAVGRDGEDRLRLPRGVREHLLREALEALARQEHDERVVADTMQVACSSVKRGSNENPRRVKKSTARSRSATAMFT